MRKTFWRTALVVVSSAIVGTWADVLLAPRFHFLEPHTHVSFGPSFHLAFIQFSMSLTLSVNWGTLVGFIVGVLIARRAK